MTSPPTSQSAEIQSKPGARPNCCTAPPSGMWMSRKTIYRSVEAHDNGDIRRTVIVHRPALVAPSHMVGSLLFPLLHASSYPLRIRGGVAP